MKTQEIRKPYNFSYSPAVRLAYYKAKSEAEQRYYPTWQRARNYDKPTILANGRQSLRWSKDRENIFVDSLERCPLNLEGDAHELTRLDHTGWYTDHHCDDVLKGAVVAYRNPRTLDSEDAETGNLSHKVYLSATYCTGWDGATIYTRHSYETASDAAQAADRIAERMAEDEREYQAKSEAEQQTLSAREEIHELNRQFFALRGEMKKLAPVQAPTICATLHADLKRIIRERSRLFDRIAKLTDNYWIAVE